MRAPDGSGARAGELGEARLGLLFSAPALVLVFAVALFPLGYAAWESLHLHELGMPWRGQPFVGLANYREALHDERFWSALMHTLFFAAVSVPLELGLGLVLALLLQEPFFGRGAIRAIALLPWALPSVVTALVFQFLFQSSATTAAWFSDARLAWLPIIIADVWKTTPFVALLLMVGLQGIDGEVIEAAQLDGAHGARMLWHVILPGLRPALLLALIFRTLDAFRVFDLVYVLTGGGPGTATEPLSLYAFSSLLRDLRFGYGSALSITVFGVTAILATSYVRVGQRSLLPGAR